MATVQFCFVSAMDGIKPTLGGQPVCEVETSGGTTTATLGNNQVCRATATSGASYVRLGGSGAVTAENGFYLAAGASIDLHGAPGDAATSVDA